MQELEQVIASAPERIAAATELQELEELEADLVGRRSVLALVQRDVGSLPAEERPAAGQAIQAAKAALTELLASRRAILTRAAADALLDGDRVDVTLERLDLARGTLHLIQQTIDEVCEIFIGLGYDVAEGPEAETGWYNFDALNTPVTHPARAESDTMYLYYEVADDESLLRTQTSPMQVRWMENHSAPVHVVVPGKVFRTDTIDASHLPVFHQIEGLAVDTGLQFSDLKGTLMHFARQFFGPQTTVRLRPHFFPFTEPSAELDVSCFMCDGGEAGCRLCGGAGWLEMLGCGMVDPNVLEAVGYDPAALTGFAFGMGVERLAMVRHDIGNIRHFIENDIRFLSQFPS
ncbi:MAG TPA: phenylalanine--tRNA ligase subunit alpha [Acidimicrobiia bacterium]|nr:phenylalanine--tRNA ligase subunit alpha [Acidimicrobiia bacterium]